jgi:hypothetical protein
MIKNSILAVCCMAFLISGAIGSAALSSAVSDVGPNQTPTPKPEPTATVTPCTNQPDPEKPLPTPSPNPSPTVGG